MAEDIKKEKEDIITLEFGDTSVDCCVLGTFELGDKEYIALEPKDGTDDVYIYGYKQISDDEFEILEIENNEEFDTASAEFDLIYNGKKEPEEPNEPNDKIHQQQYCNAPYDGQQYYQYPNGRTGQKNKLTAGLLAIFLGSLGIHKFYMGWSKQGIIMLLVSIFGSLLFGLGPVVMGIIALIEGIKYLTKTNAEFYEVYERGGKAWF